MQYGGPFVTGHTWVGPGAFRFRRFLWFFLCSLRVSWIFGRFSTTLGRFGAKPYKFIRFGAMDVTKPYKFIRFGSVSLGHPCVQQLACTGRGR